jgi:tetratricopeptide (TPR) repeat protein
MPVGRRIILSVAAFLFLAGIRHTPAQSSKASSQDAAQQADAAFHAGYAARQAGQLEIARARFADVVRLQPKIPEGHEALAVVLLELGKPKEAIPELLAADRLKPSDPAIQTNLALAYAGAGDASSALPHFESALQLLEKANQSPDAALLDNYARALSAANKLQEALDQLGAEEQLTGPTAVLEDAIGSVNAQMGRWDDARGAFERAMEADGYFAPARIHLGIVQREQHDIPASLATLEAATRLEPPMAEAFAEYGRTLARANQDEAAVPAFEQALKLKPDLPGAPVDLAMSLQRLGRQQEAIPWFQKALEQEQHNSSVLINLALALTLTGKAKEAMAYLDRAEKENPKDPAIYKNRGVAHIQLSAFDEAIADFKAALALDPNDPQLHYDLGLAYKFKDRLDESVAELKRAGEMDPTLEDPPYTLGITYMQMGKLDEAVVELRKAVALRQDNGNAWSILGSTLKQDGKLDEAAEALEKAIPLLPGQPGPMVTLAGVLSEQAASLSTQADAADAAGDQQKAEQLRSQMKELRGRAADYRRQGAELSRAAVNRQRANFALNAGNQLLLRGQIADAVSRYQESIAADPTFADPHSQLAIAYDRQGRTQDAASERAKAAELSSSK